MPNPRRKKIEDGIQPTLNPLAILFGQALVKRRNGPEYHYNVKDMAQSLGLGEPTYRFIESGVYALHPSRSFDLAKSLHFDWMRLSSVLVAVQTLERATDSYSALVRCKDDIYFHAPKLFEILDAPKWLWQLIKQKNVSATKICKDERIRSSVGALENYLCGGTAQDDHSLKESTLSFNIDNIPPFYLEPLNAVSALYQNFSSVPPPRITDEQLGKFEMDNQKRFEKIYGLIRNYDSVKYMAEEQSHIFPVSYLMESNFNSIRILLAYPGENMDASLESRLQKELQQSAAKTVKRNTNRDAKLINKTVRQKIFLRILPQNHPLEGYFKYDSFQDRKSPEEDERATSINNIWVYDLIDPKNTIAFLDDSYPGQKPPIFSTSCTRELTNSLLNEIREYWEFMPKSEGA